MRTIIPCLWFDAEAEEAANFYVSVFKNGRINGIIRNGEGGPGPAGSVLTVEFELDGNTYLGLNGGPMFKLSEAFSLMVYCQGQKEVDHFWNGLLAGGGKEQQCGWLKDRYGMSWQIVPEIVRSAMNGSDPARAARIMQAVWQMVKLDVAELEKAAVG